MILRSRAHLLARRWRNEEGDHGACLHRVELEKPRPRLQGVSLARGLAGQAREEASAPVKRTAKAAAKKKAALLKAIAALREPGPDIQLAPQRSVLSKEAALEALTRAVRYMYVAGFTRAEIDDAVRNAHPILGRKS